MRTVVRQILLASALACAASAACAAALARRDEARREGPSPQTDERLAEVLARVGRNVERYHEGLFGLSFVETLTVEELRKDLSTKKAREYVFQSVVLREELSKAEGDYYAETHRRIKAVDGR